MKKYFLHINDETIGPFDLEELKARSITKKTPVWFEGMEHWKTAGEIPDLNSVFVVIPPPITTFSAAPSTPVVESKNEERKIMGLSKNTFLIVSGLLILAIGTIFFKTIRENRSRELKIKNHKTEIENYQYQLLQKEIENQKIIEAEIEKAAAERMSKKKKQTGSGRILEIEQKLEEYQNKIRETEKKLKNASGFKLLRTATQKKEQMDLLQKKIDSFESEIVKLENESDQLKLELEKIP